MTFVTNRSAYNVQRVKEMRASGTGGTYKGSYNRSDLNRVEGDVQEIAAALVSTASTLSALCDQLGVAMDKLYVPYDSAVYDGISVKTDWAYTDVPRETEMARYLGNVNLIRAAFGVYLNPPLPDTMTKLTYEGANAIEAHLKKVADILSGWITTQTVNITNAAAWQNGGYIDSGLLNCGMI